MDNDNIESSKMSEEDKRECAKDKRDLAYQDLQFSLRRISELPDEFTRLQVQIATILIAFAGVFFSFFAGSDANIQHFSYHFALLLKFTFALGLLFLIISLAIGLIHIKRKEWWWDDKAEETGARYGGWLKVVQKLMTFDEANAFAKGTTNGKEGVVHSPKWTWIIQTICLGLGIVLLFVLFLIFLFH